MLKKISVLVPTLALLAACSSAPQVQMGEDAEVIGDTLHRVDNSRAKMAYVDPGADFSKYKSVLLQPLGVDSIEVVQPGSSVASRRNWELTDQDRKTLRKIYREAMVAQLEERGLFPIATEAGDDVLEIAAMVTAIAPSAPKDDSQSRPAGSTYIVTTGVGSIAVAIAFGDSETGEVLALVKDSRSSTGFRSLNNSVSNQADLRRMFNSWAVQINDSLTRVAGKE